MPRRSRRGNTSQAGTNFCMLTAVEVFVIGARKGCILDSGHSLMQRMAGSAGKATRYYCAGLPSPSLGNMFSSNRIGPLMMT